jgi:hypothetical protein
MNINLFPLITLWAILAAGVIGMIIYRKMVAAAEDDALHVTEGEAGKIPRQAEVAHKLEIIDRWGKMLTVVTIVSGVIVGGLYVYESWLQASSSMAH